MSAPKLTLVESNQAAPAPAPARPPRKTRAASPAAKKKVAASKPDKRAPLAGDVMTSPATCCSVRETLNDAARLMWEKNLGAIVVADDDNRPVGMITDRDVSMAAYTQGVPLFHSPVTSAMSKTLVSAKVTTSLDELREMMAAAGVRRLPIVDESDRLCGVVGLADLMKESIAPLSKDRKRGSSPAMLLQLIDAIIA